MTEERLQNADLFEMADEIIEELDRISEAVANGQLDEFIALPDRFGKVHVMIDLNGRYLGCMAVHTVKEHPLVTAVWNTVTGHLDIKDCIGDARAYLTWSDGIGDAVELIDDAMMYRMNGIKVNI